MRELRDVGTKRDGQHERNGRFIEEFARDPGGNDWQT